MYKITIKLESDTLIGSSEGYGAIIDTDVVFDEIGLPYIPARRVKGVLRDAAEDLNSLYSYSNDTVKKIEIEKLFGKTGDTEKPTSFFISNLYLEEYEKNKEHLEYLISKAVIGKDNIMDNFTSLRNQTSIDDKLEIAKRTSLRTSRVLDKGLEFYGEISLPAEFENQLDLICKAVKKIGTKRNRGLGKVTVSIKTIAGGELR